MVGKLGRWIIDFVVLLFALYAFAFMPLGERTGLEHLRAILGSPPAERAGEELLEAGGRLKSKVLGGDGRALHKARSAPALSRVTGMADAGADASL